MWPAANFTQKWASTLTKTERRRRENWGGNGERCTKATKGEQLLFQLQHKFPFFCLISHSAAARVVASEVDAFVAAAASQKSPPRERTFFNLIKLEHTPPPHIMHTRNYIYCGERAVHWIRFSEPFSRPDDDDDDARWDDVKNLNIMRHDDFFPWEKRRNGPRGLVWTSRARCCNMSKWEIYSSHSLPLLLLQEMILNYIWHIFHIAHRIFPRSTFLIISWELWWMSHWRWLNARRPEKKRSFWVMTHA